MTQDVRTVSRARVNVWAALDGGQRRWLLSKGVAIPTVNAVVMGVVAWLLTRGLTHVGLLYSGSAGKPSVLVETLQNLFLLPLIMTYAVTPQIRRDRRRGRLAVLDHSALPNALQRFPSGLLRRGARLGVICFALAGPISILVLVAFASGGMSPSSFALYKGILAEVLGLLITPVVAVCAMADEPPPAGKRN